MKVMPYLNEPVPRLALIQEIEQLWQERIPLASQLGIRIVRLDERSLEVVAPLAANCNHMLPSQISR